MLVKFQKTGNDHVLLNLKIIISARYVLLKSQLTQSQQKITEK
jgi:hypothetical protein